MISLSLLTHIVFASKNSQSSAGDVLHNFLMGANNAVNSSQPSLSQFSQPPASNNVYSNDTDGISVVVPPGWGAEAGQNQANDTLLTAILLNPPLSQDPKALVNVNIYKDPQPSTNNSVSQYLRDEMELSKNQFDSFKMGSASLNVNVAGQPGYLLQSSFKDSDSNPVKSLEIGTLLQGVGYYVFYTAPPKLFNTFLPQVNQIVQSLKVNPPQ
jgi:hypothetical protein